MKILKVYDTMSRAKFEAEKYYKECLDNGMDVRFRTPYRFEVGENTFMFVSRQAELMGMRFDRIDDCTTCGIPARLRACEYPMKYKLSDMFTNEEQLESVSRGLRGEITEHMREFIRKLGEEEG